jgi:large subunit ribosomal protein L7/L12
LGLTLTDNQHTAISRQLERRHNDGSAASSMESKPEDSAPVVQLVDLKLTGFDEKSKIKVIKEVRSIAGLGLKEAKELVEGFPKTIQKGLKPELADELKAKLEAVGAKIELV